MDGGTLDRQGLRRVIALLVVLAGLAEKAARRPFPVRWLLLVLLGRGERVAQTFFARATEMETGLEDGPEPGFGVDGALMRAWRLRWLAALFCALLEELCTLAGEGLTPAPAPRAVGRPTVAGLPKRAPLDTS